MPRTDATAITAPGGGRRFTPPRLTDAGDPRGGCSPGRSDGGKLVPVGTGPGAAVPDRAQAS